jgi:hypothetical protein
MRVAITFMAAIASTTTLLSAALATPVATHNPAPPAVTVDCRKAGNEVSSLIDNRTASPNLPAARAVFQVGIMECMEGDDVSANKHYEQAKELLASDAPVTPSPVEKK